MEVEQVLDSAVSEKRWFDPLLYGGGTEENHMSDMPYLEKIVQGRQSDGAGNLYDTRSAC